MAIPITKKASSSCMKNMELGSMANVNEALIAGAANTAPKFIDVKQTVEDSMGEVKTQKIEDAPDTTEENGGTDPGEGPTE
tara:strand:- start:430 stop:672 length:243 start_codon:yes stop_codon:yes gene_type:complete